MAAPLHAETPAQQMLSVIQDIFAGESPSMSRLVAVQQALQRSQDVYRPANKDLQVQLRGASDIDVSHRLPCPIMHQHTCMLPTALCCTQHTLHPSCAHHCLVVPATIAPAVAFIAPSLPWESIRSAGQICLHVCCAFCMQEEVQRALVNQLAGAPNVLLSTRHDSIIGPHAGLNEEEEDIGEPQASRIDIHHTRISARWYCSSCDAYNQHHLLWILL